MSAAVEGGNTSLLNGLLAWWGCHDNAGTSRQDTTGNGNTLLETGGVVASAPGLIGQAASFTKANYLKQSSSIVTGGAFTFACWANPTDIAATYVLLSQQVAAAQLKLQIGTLNVQFGVGSGAAATYSTPLTAGLWAHLCGTYDKTTARLYVNGVPVATSTPTSVVYSQSTFALGARSDAGSSIFNGLLQLSGIWSRALTDGEAALLYNSGSGRDYPFAA